MPWGDQESRNQRNEVEDGIDRQIEDVVLEGEHTEAAGECHPVAEVPFAGRGRFEPEHGKADYRDNQRRGPGKQQAYGRSGPDED